MKIAILLLTFSIVTVLAVIPRPPKYPCISMLSQETCIDSKDTSEECVWCNTTGICLTKCHNRGDLHQCEMKIFSKYGRSCKLISALRTLMILCVIVSVLIALFVIGYAIYYSYQLYRERGYQRV
jgi:hypothetical protein